MTAYYNEIDPFAAQWLRNLIEAGLIAPGHVDERSIEDVKPSELAGYTQCHFFAGIGGWSYALRLAGWPDDKPVWTGSCPCQPFSAAGKGAGFADERHLWPAFFHLIQHGKRRDIPVFGEQVASSDGLGWLDLVQADLQGAGYSVRAEDRCGASIGAPHIRQRLYWMANTHSGEQQGFAVLQGDERNGQDAGRSQSGSSASSCSNVSGMAHTTSERRRQTGCHSESNREAHEGRSGDRNSNGNKDDKLVRLVESSRPGTTNGFWRDADWLRCTDDKWRPVEPGTFPLANGVSGRVGRLRAYGNAIVPQVAAEVIRAYMSCH